MHAQPGCHLIYKYHAFIIRDTSGTILPTHGCAELTIPLNITYWVPQKQAQICTVIHVHLYWEGCVIICGYLWGARYIIYIFTN